MGKRIFKAKVKGVPELRKAFLAQPEKVQLGVMDALEIITRLILNRASAKILKGSKTGRMYGRHQSSAQGEAPASDTGKLIGSGQTEIDKSNPKQLWGLVSFTAFYARWLEFGTRFMAARPFFFPTIDELKERIVSIFASSIKARLKK